MKKILIIEDNTEINHLMADALKKAGYECKQAFSGTGYNEQVRFFPDFSARMYFMNAI